MSNPLTNGRHKKMVSEVQQNARSYDGKNGKIYIHMVTFADGSKGEYHSSSDTNKKFAIGQDVEFECEVKVNGQYTNYKIKPVDNGGGFGGNRGGGVDMKLYAATESFKLAKQTAEKNPTPLTKEQLVEIAKSYYNAISEIAAGKA